MGRAIISLMLVLVSAGLTPAAEAGGSGAGSLIQARDFSGLIGIPGFSNAMLNNHFKLYQGYVKNTNALMEKLESLRIEMKDKTPEYAELKRRLGWEWNGVRLHELYFENLGGKEPLGEDTALGKKLRESFGSIERWKNDFVSTGLMRGIGWVVAYWEPGTGKILNVWINEHDGGHIAGARPILVMDVFEHAYMPDYQLDRARYIDTFFRNIRWEAASDRFEKCMADSGVGVSAMEDLMREHGLLDRLLLIDEAILRHLDRNEAFPSEAIAECMDITRHFVQDYHEKLEEQHLFVRFNKAGRLVELTAVLEKQHQAGRKLVDDILAREKSGDPADHKAMAESLRSFIRMYRPHKAREDTILFPAFHAIVTPEEYDRLGDAFEAEEEKQFGEGGFEKMVGRVERIERTLGIDALVQFTP